MIKWPRCALLLLCLTACAPASPLPPQSALLAQANPLEKEGQIRLELQIQAAEVKGLETAPRDSAGRLATEGADFRIARENGPELARGKVSGNTILLPPEKIGPGPYQLTISLAGGQVLEARLQDTLSAGEKRVIRAENVRVVTQTCGDNCVQVGGDLNIDQSGTETEGPNCPGIGNQCSSGARK